MQLLFSYARTLRPIGWIPAWFALTMGMIDGGFFSLTKVFLALLVFGPLVLGANYILNFVADLKLDKLNAGKKDLEMASQPFSTGLIAPRQGYVVALILIAGGLIISSFISPWFFLFAAYSALIGTAYSLGPRLKSRPFLDLLANASTFGTAAYLAGWSAFQPPNAVSISSLVWISLLVGATYILTVLLDAVSDKQGGQTTIATFLGTKKSLHLSFLLYGLSSISFLIALYTHSLTVAYWILAPFIILGVKSYLKLIRDPSRIHHVAKRGVFSAVFGVTTLIPIYVVLTILGISDETIIRVILNAFG